MRATVPTISPPHPERWIETPPSVREVRFWVYLLGPVALMVALWVPLTTLAGLQPALGLAGLLALYLLPVAAKENVIPFAISSLPYPWFVVGGYFVLMDVSICIFFILNYDHTKRIPFLGRWIADFERNGARRLAQSRWMARLGVIALTAVMFIALDGSGAAIVSIIGRALGYRPRQILPMVLAGSLLSAMPIAYGSETVLRVVRRFGDPRLFTLALSIVLVGITLAVMYRGSRSRAVEVPPRGGASEEE